jgi:hypothetical protein
MRWGRKLEWMDPLRLRRKKRKRTRGRRRTKATMRRK